MRIFDNSYEITKEVERIDLTSRVISYEVGDFIYFASDFPFNHLFVELGLSVNAISATMKVEYLGQSWSEAVEVRDGTNAFSESGFIEFTPNRNQGWSMIVDSAQAGVSTVVYNKYWARISFNVDLSASVELNYFGNVFSDDIDLFSEYPIFDDANFMNAFKAGKTSWKEQHIKASEIIIQDLQKKGVILGPEQILDRKKFLSASVCKVAEIVYNAFGNDYAEQRKAAKEEYSKRLNLSQFNVDANNDGMLDKGEVVMKQGWLSR